MPAPRARAITCDAPDVARPGFVGDAVDFRRLRSRRKNIAGARLGPLINSMNTLLSSRRPRHGFGARRLDRLILPRALRTAEFARIALRNSSNRPGWARASPSCLAFRTFRSEGCRLHFLANATAFWVRSPSNSRSPSDGGGFLGTDGAPEVPSERLAKPATRGGLCTPGSGQQPHLDFRNAQFAVGPGRRRMTASATRGPPPSAVPWIAATTGFEQFSIRATIRALPCMMVGLPNSVESAGENVSALAPDHHALSCPSPSASSIAATAPPHRRRRAR